MFHWRGARYSTGGVQDFPREGCRIFNGARRSFFIALQRSAALKRKIHPPIALFCLPSAPPSALPQPCPDPGLARLGPGPPALRPVPCALAVAWPCPSPGPLCQGKALAHAGPCPGPPAHVLALVQWLVIPRIAPLNLSPGEGAIAYLGPTSLGAGGGSTRTKRHDIQEV